MGQEPLCHCGKPLHYTDPGIRAYVEAQIERLGPELLVHDGDGVLYRVQRHYIALHGLKEADLPYLGFPRVHQL